MDRGVPPALTSAVAGKEEDDEDEASELNASIPTSSPSSSSSSFACGVQATIYSSLDIKKTCKKLLVRR
jgi:hypothetical protein